MLKLFGFGKPIVNFKEDEIIKEGTTNKESRLRKIWRERWTVLTKKFLLTYKEKQLYKNPTEIIKIENIKTVSSGDNPSSFTFVSKLII